MTAADIPDLTGSTVVQPDPSVSNAFHFSVATVQSKPGRASRQDAARAGNGQLNVPNASSLSRSGRAPRQDVPTVQAEPLPAQALPVQDQASQTPAITLPTRAYVPPAAVPPAYTPPPVQTARPLTVTATPARTTGTQSFTQTFTAPGRTAGSSPRGAVGGVAPGSPGVTFTPSPAKYTYLGYAESDGDTLAILHLGDRDETVAQGQLIPGTRTQLVSVTPARVTLKTDRIITQVPLEAQP